MDSFEESFCFLYVVSLEEKYDFFVVFCIFPDMLEVESLERMVTCMLMQHIFDDIFLETVECSEDVRHKREGERLVNGLDRPRLPEMCHHVHRPYEDCHSDVLRQAKYLMIHEVVDDDGDDRPRELEDRRDVDGSRLESAVVDVHGDESSRTRDREEIEPLSRCRYAKSISPLRDDEEPKPDDEHSDTKSEHRDDFWMVIFQEIFREVGRASPRCSSTEGAEGGEDLLLSVWCRRDSVWEGDEVACDERERDEEIRQTWYLLMSDDHGYSDREYRLELLYEDRDREGDESHRSECCREKKRPDDAREERDGEECRDFSAGEVCSLIRSYREYGDEDKSDQVLEEYERRRREPVEWATQESIDCPECSCDDDEKWSEWLHGGLFKSRRFPDRDREEKYRYDDRGTHRAEWTKYRDDDLLWDDISIETHTTERKSCQDLRFYCWLSHIARKREQCEEWVDDEGDHRECYMEISDREDDRTRILQNATTGESRVYVAGKWLECFFVRAVPVPVGMIREVGCVSDTDECEDEDDEIFAHRKNKKRYKKSPEVTRGNSKTKNPRVRRGKKYMCSYQVVWPWKWLVRISLSI